MIGPIVIMTFYQNLGPKYVFLCAATLGVVVGSTAIFFYKRLLPHILQRDAVEIYA